MPKSIGQKFNTVSLLWFTFPSIIMMIFMSLYTIVDGIFIARYVGSKALSSANIVYPAVNLMYAVGVMLSTGGSAIVAKKLGEGKKKEARNDFSFLVAVGILVSLLFMFVCIVFTTQISYVLGSDDVLLKNCNSYLQTLMFFAVAAMFQMLYQMFMVTAGKPGLGLAATILGGVANAVLDYVFMGIMGMGVSGAAIATGIGQLIPAIIGSIYFLARRGELYFVKFHADIKSLCQACFNGASEMVTNVSTALVTYLFNIILMSLVGESGVAAITIILYAQFLFNSLYFGFSMGVAPVISYNYGAKKEHELRKITKISKRFVIVSSIIIVILSFLMSDMVAGVFVDRNTDTFLLASSGLVIFAISFLFSGYNIFASSYFTALSDGKTSAIISFSRTFIFILLSLLLLPKFLGVTGVWLAIPVAEFISMGLCMFFHHSFKRNLQSGKGDRIENTLNY